MNFSPERFYEFSKNDSGRYTWLAKDGSDKVIKRSERSFKTKKECTQDAYQNGYDAPEMRYGLKNGDELWIRVRVVPDERMRRRGKVVIADGWPNGKLMDAFFEMREVKRAS